MRALVKMLVRRGPLRCDRGATAVEYGLIIALIVLAIIVSLNSVATKTTNMWNDVADKVNKS
ncbi:Flp family type IVb pilin [Sphingobium sp.]|uniref:Flp family type IVb pilin n=1 Tax=Sphingobium sp. TaxID=1912891 RepID=UPI003B3BD354